MVDTVKGRVVTHYALFSKLIEFVLKSRPVLEAEEISLNKRRFFLPPFRFQIFRNVLESIIVHYRFLWTGT